MKRSAADLQRQEGNDLLLAVWIGVAGSVAGLAYDPLARAADAKRVALLLVGVGALALPLLHGPHRSIGRVSIGGAARWWVALVALLAVSALRELALGVLPLGTWIGATATLLAALQLPRHRVRAVARHVALALGGGAALWALWEWAQGARGLYVHGGQGNPNWLGLLLALTLPLAGEQARRPRRPMERAAVVALVALQGIGLYLSHSRVAWAALAVAALVASGPSLAALIRPRGALAGLLMLILLVGVGRAGAQIVGESPESAADDPKVTIGARDTPLPVAWSGRVWIWRTSLYAAARARPFGVGLGGFATAYLDEQGRQLMSLPPRQAARRFLNATTAHNDWLELAVDAGLLAPLLLLMAVGSALWEYLRPTRPRGRWRAGGAALLAGAICAVGDSPLQQPAILVPLVLILAAAPRSSVVRIPLRPLQWAVLLAAAVLLAPATSTWLAVRLQSAARTAEPGLREALLARAARLDPRSGELALTRGLDALLLGDAEAALPELVRSRPLLANVGTDVAIGNAQLLLGQANEAAASYERALLRHPGSFRAHANLAQALSQLGSHEQARQHLLVARQLQPGHPKLRELEQQLAERAAAPP